MSNPLKSIVRLVLVLAMIGPSAVPTHGDTLGITADQVDKLVQPYLDGGIVDAVSVGVVQGDKSWGRHFGKLSQDSKSAPNDSSVYEIGSVSKVFTGLLLAHAVESGRVQLDQPVGTLMKELQTANKEVGDSISLRHLSTHVSGLPRLPDNLKPADPTNPYADYGREELVEFMSRVRPVRSPEEESEYSNLAVGLLGNLLAAESGLSYEQLLDQAISKPLGMNDTTITLTDDQKQRLAPPHNADRQADVNWDIDALAGAGAIRSTITDMLRFIQATLDPPNDQLGRAIELAWKEQLPSKGDAFAMGLGWHIARDGQTRWHNGQTGGYHSMLMVNRKLRVGVVVLCNTASGQVDALAESVMQTMAGMKVEPANFTQPNHVEPKVVARLQGQYQIVPGFVLTVRADGEKLFVQATNQPENRVFPESETEWKYRIVDAQLTFDLPANGKCKSVTLHQNGRDMAAHRVGD